MSSQFYLYLSDREAKSVSGAKIAECLNCSSAYGQWLVEHHSDDEFSGQDSWLEMIAAEYGTLPDWEMRYIPDKADVFQSNYTLVETLNLLLKAFSGDLLLLSGLDLPMLKRVAGVVTLENLDSAWNDSMLLRLHSCRRLSMSWTIGYGAGCQGGNKKDVQLPECMAVLKDVIQKNGTFRLSLKDAPEIGPQELTVEIEGGNAVIGLGEDDGEDYIVRSYTNPAPGKEKIEILGNLWDSRMVCQSKADILSIVENFFENGDVSREILS